MTTSREERVLVIGASGGVGSCVARRLAARGAHLALAGRREAPLNRLSEELAGGHVFANVDATNFSEVDDLVVRARGALGGLSGLVLAVGSILLKPAHATSDDEWQATLAQNLTSAFAVVRAAGRHLREDHAAIVLFSTAAAHVGLANHEAIAAAKAGVEGLARAASATYAGAGLRFNVIAPGLLRTPLSARVTSNATSLEVSIAMHPLGRIGEPDEVASLACWLLAGDNDWVTGQSFGIDGGLSTVRPRR